MNRELQIRRPNSLYNYPQKKSVELLLDILGFNFYVKNPDKTEFDISWVELREDYGISITNKDSLKSKLQQLQDSNFISDLKMWNYGFSYGFNDTVVDLEEFRKPATWTFLDYRVMKTLNTITYRIYTLAYKFFDFRDRGNYGNETRFLEKEEFLKLFNYSVKDGNTVLNRLLGNIRKAQKFLETLNIRFNIRTRKFGKPTRSVKFVFEEVPKLASLERFLKIKKYPKAKKTVDETVSRNLQNQHNDLPIPESTTTKELLKQDEILQTKSDESENLTPEKIRENRQKVEFESVIKATKKELVYRFMTNFLGKVITEEHSDQKLQDLKKWAVDKFTENIKISYDYAEKIFHSLQKNGSFERLSRDFDFFKDSMVKFEELNNQRIATISSSDNRYNRPVKVEIFNTSIYDRTFQKI